LSEKEVKDRYRGDLSRSLFINAKQTKGYPPEGKLGRLKRKCARRPYVTRKITLINSLVLASAGKEFTR
jgi:hypothetical protein